MGDLFAESLGRDRPGRAAAARDGDRRPSRSTRCSRSSRSWPCRRSALLSYRYRLRVRQGARAQRAHEGEIASLAGEALSAMPVVKASGSERFEGERVHVRSAERMRIGIQVSRLQARFDGLIGVVSAVATALVIGLGVHPDLRRGAVAGRPGRVRDLRAPPQQPSASDRPGGDQGLADDGARRPDRRDPRRRRARRGPSGRLRRPAGERRRRARAT